MAYNSRRPARSSAQASTRTPVIPHTQPSLSYSQARPPPQTSSASRGQGAQGAMVQGVASGAIGSAYGPYSYNPTQSRDMRGNTQKFASNSQRSSPENPAAAAPVAAVINTTSVPHYAWDKDPDLDDALHDPRVKNKHDRSFAPFSSRGWMNVSALLLIVGGLVTLFAGYPIISFYSTTKVQSTGFNIGGINGSGQIPDLPGLPKLIDDDTPSSAYSRTGLDGVKYNLVFSDEFNLEGRSFYPGEDPFWEGQDFHYWPTGDLEWYDPSAITTKDGKLVITLSMENVHDLNWKSGMLTSWNKLCFTTGYIEFSASMPGRPEAPGLWPGAWTMGNLGRAGFGATTDGTWPYSYDSCDLGTFPNQTDQDGVPEAALTGSDSGAEISYLPGQRLSSCTCEGGDHPGPSTSVGRGAPEIDIIEHQIDVSLMQGGQSQSYQIAPFNYQYYFDNDSSVTTIYDDTLTDFNTYRGGQFQQAVSAVTLIDRDLYDDKAYGTYGMEWYSNPDKREDGFIEWVSSGIPSWKITADSIGPDDTMQISSRLISEEPMYMVFNLGMSPSFQLQDFKHLEFPSQMYVDWVRVYQRVGTKDGMSCSPPKMPTFDYINDHINAYSNPNVTTWEQAGYKMPRNSKYDGC